MRAWTRPEIPRLPGSSAPPHIYDSGSRTLTQAAPGAVARLYVCGITPYDATHIGHANTYLAFDTLQRVWRDAGYRVHYAQNITDIDDPLLERAKTTGTDWRTLADEQIELFRADMAGLGIIPPEDYVAVTEVIDGIAEAVAALLENGTAYRVASEEDVSDDIYFDIAAAERIAPWRLGEESNLDRETMLRYFRERGGDPDRAGKRDPLDPLLWRAVRDGEPSWPSALGAGRPGWHIECSVIALQHLGSDFTVQGGGSDLLFPHHEMSAGHAAALTGAPLARVFSHAGMVGYQGEKMSKSLGNLVLVSRLRADGADPSAIRLGLLAHHYRADWEWTDDVLTVADARLGRWRSAARRVGPVSATGVLVELRDALSDDLDTPRALAVVDAAVEPGVDDPGLLADAVHALLGVDIRVSATSTRSSSGA